jgi:transcription elongation factor GreA
MQDASAPRPPSLIKLGKLANTQAFDKLAELWPDAVACPDHPAEDLLAVAGQVHRLGQVEQADTFASTLIEQIEARDGAAAALAAAREATRQMPLRAPGARGHLHRLYRTCNPDFEALPELLALLAGPAADQHAAVKLLDRYCALQPGRYLVDYNHVDPGVVEAIDPQRGIVQARFGDRRQEYGPATLEKAIPRPDDFFPALLLYAPDRLRELAHDDPVAFVTLAIKADLDGVLTYKNLKQHLTRLFDDRGWQAWWRAHRETLRRDPLLNTGGGSQPSFSQRRQADRYEDRLRRQFDRMPAPLDQLKQVIAYLDEIARKGARFAADPELLVHFGNGAARIAVAALQQQQPALALAGLAVHQRVAALGAAVARPNPRAALAVLARLPDRGSLVAELPEGLLMAALDYLRESQPEHWAEVWSQVLPRAGRRLCDQLARGLIEHGRQDTLRQTLVQALERPTACPDLVAWLWRSRHATGQVGRTLQQFAELTPYRCLEALLVMTNAVGHLLAVSGQERHLKVLETARADLTCNKAQPLLEVIRTAAPEQLMRLRALMVDNDGLNPALRSRLKLMLRAEHPQLFTEQASPWLDESVIYTTAEGRRRIEDQLIHIRDVEIPAVARQIGEAAAHGDLSENSEWTAALEKRDQLASRAATLESELKQARLIDLDTAAADHVTVGTRITVRESGGTRQREFAFLGPWDADPDRGVLYYRAPLALAFMGKQVGATISFGEGEARRQWEILSIDPAIS